MKLLVGLLAFAILSSSPAPGRVEGGSSTRVLRRPHGMVASTSALASEAGAEVLRRGGNAVDAAVATGLALAVTYPAAGNLGGGGFMVLRMASGETAAVDFRETAPAAAHRNVYLNPDGTPAPDASTVGHRASGVPGTVAGLALARDRWGTRPWSELVAPARRLADEGFALSDALARDLSSNPHLARFPESRRVFQRGGRDWTAGETFRQPDLARTLERLSREGPAGFYRGETARLVVEEMRQAGGWMTLDDLSGYSAVVRPVLRGRYRDHEILAMPPPSSGGVALLQMLAMLEPFKLHEMPLDSPQRNHLLIEAMRRAFADRSAHLGDPDFVPVPVAGLLAPDYLAAFHRSINPVNATPSSIVSAGQPPPRETEQTTHYSVVDRWGGAVSVTYTLNSAYGSGVTVRGAGFLLNNEMDDFAAQPGKPNQFGLIQGEQNAVSAGKRPLSSMTPTIVLRDGKPWLVTGSPGGPTIINSVLHMILNTVDGGLPLQAATDRWRMHHQWLPDAVSWEAAMPEALRASLVERGHSFNSSSRGIGDVQSVMIEPASGVRVGVSDRRSRDGAPAGH